MPRSAVEKLNTSRQEEKEATDTASESEGDGTLTLPGLTLTSCKTQTQEDDFVDEITDIYVTRVDLNHYLELKFRMFHKQHNVVTISHGLLQATDNLSRERSAT